MLFHNAKEIFRGITARKDYCLAAQRTHLCASNREHIAQLRQFHKCEIVRCCQPIT